MNKKIIITFLVVICALSTIAISVWGKIPDNGNRINVVSISFIDSSQENGECALNEEGNKIISLERGTKEYQLEYLINPEDASDMSVQFMITSGDAAANVSSTGFVTFLVEADITVRIYSNLTDGKFDDVILCFTGEIHDVVTGDDIF